MKKAIRIVVLLAMTVLAAPPANAKYPSSWTEHWACSDNNYTLGTFKIQKAKLLKVAVDNRGPGCAPWAVVRWGYWTDSELEDNVILVARGTATDLWKKELKPVPREINHLDFLISHDVSNYCDWDAPVYVAKGNKVKAFVCSN